MSFLVFLSSADAADDARAVLDRAVRAHGGEERIARTTRGHLKVESSGKLDGGAFQVTWEETFDLPARYRQTMEGKLRGMPFRLDMGVEGGRGWMRRGDGPPQDMPFMDKPPLELHWHAILAQLVRMRERDTRLTLLGELRKNNRDLVGVRAVSPRAAADLYFDRTTGLLARARQQLPYVLAARDLVGEILYEEFRDVAGVRYPIRLRATADEDTAFTLAVSSVEFLDKVDAGTFTRPQPAEAEPPKEETASPRRADERPARRDVRLIAATLIGGAVVGAVWLAVRLSARRKQAPPPR